MEKSRTIDPECEIFQIRVETAEKVYSVLLVTCLPRMPQKLSVGGYVEPCQGRMPDLSFMSNVFHFPKLVLESEL